MAFTTYEQCNCATGHGVVVTATDECGKPSLGCSIVQSGSGVYSDSLHKLPFFPDHASDSEEDLVEASAYTASPTYNTHTATWTLQASYQWSVGYSTVECTAVDSSHQKASCRFTVSCTDQNNNWCSASPGW